jgi:putative ABC transport system permease protein
MALGASRSDVVRLVLGHGLALTLIGISIGLLVSLAVGRVLSSLLFEVNPTDGASFAATAVILSAAALVACYVPARRAASVDPTEALRAE